MKTDDNILVDITQGLTNNDISVKYGIAMPTVKEHIRLLFEKLGVANRAPTVKEHIRLLFEKLGVANRAEAASLAIRRKMA